VRGARELLRLRAKLLLALGAERAATAAFDRLLDLAPDDAHGLASRGHLRARRGDAEAAIADLQRLVTRHADARAADWFNLAFVLEQQGRDAEAERAFRRALEFDPALDRAWYGLGAVLLRAGRFDEAVQALQRNTELQPMNPQGWCLLARAHRALGAHDAAQAIARRLQDFEPRAAAELRRENRATA